MRRDESTHRTAAGIVAGLVAGTAFLLTMAVDIALTRYKSNDLRLLSGMVPGGGRIWPILGTAMHFFNSAALGAVYAHVEDRLPGRGWVKGTMFGLAENMILWPIITILDRVHPEIKRGTLQPFNRFTPFMQEILRHIAYGAVLGWAYEFLRKKK
ncbi:MAG: hypothetical protein EA415_04845 [Sphaerobacteraceae bacterium]|nr:MAG: hypothetical protein EA415_04845 [Sphaerobacteraceae bacterium]